MPGLLGKILPREKSFFDMFVQQAENVHQGTMALLDMLENYDHEAARRVSEVTAYEHKGDTITHGIITRLNQTFITPFDREDIHELASKIDDVIDLVDAAARRFVTYDIKCVRPGVIELAKTVRDSAEQVLVAVRVLGKQDHILDHCIEINRLENQADAQTRELLANLFDQERDPIQVIKWKEIIESLELATDKCEDVANVIETVTLKNA
jgi:uncharacterized protein